MNILTKAKKIPTEYSYSKSERVNDQSTTWNATSELESYFG